MKKQLFIIIGLLAIQKIQSQTVFCPPGAEWHYLFSPIQAFAVQPYYNERIKYTKDSVVGIDTVKVLHHKRYYNYCNFSSDAYTLIKQKGDTVFMKSLETRNLWQILYNYSATAGQSWTITVSSIYNFSTTLTYTVSVDSVTTTNINNYVLRKLKVKYRKQGSSFEESSDITERLGCARFMFNYTNPSGSTDADMALGCICYRDSAFGLKQFVPYSCDGVPPVGINEVLTRNSTIQIYPSPAKEFVTIANDWTFTGESVLGIYDFSGREVKQVVLRSADDRKVYIDKLTAGLYFLRLKTEERILSGKLIKQD